MKIRTDFVTNSSSSSFVIAVKNDDAHKALIRKLRKPDGEEKLEAHVTKTPKSFNTYIDDYDGGGPLAEEEKDSVIEMATSLLADGFVIVFKDAEEESTIELILETSTQDAENVKLLYTSLDYGF